MKKTTLALLLVLGLLLLGLYFRTNLSSNPPTSSQTILPTSTPSPVVQEPQPIDETEAEIIAKANSPEAAELVLCTSSQVDAPVSLEGWKTSLYAAKLSTYSTEAGVTSNGATVFSIQGLIDRVEANSIYFRIETTNRSSATMTGSNLVFEVCDSYNQTTKWNSTAHTESPASQDSVSNRTIFLHAHPKILKPGNYRVDAYLFTNGAWHLVDRINSITLTE